MFAWILKSAIVSVLFIFLIHHLIKFFKNMLTTPKIKDFVTRPAQKYERMFNAINHDTPLGVSDGTTRLEDLIPNGDDNHLINPNNPNNSNNPNNPTKKNNMKEELKQYLKTHLRDGANASASDGLEPFDISSAPSFTPF